MQESEKCGEIIFPFSASESKPNRFLAIVASENIKQFGIDVEKVTRARWHHLSIQELNDAKLLNGTLKNFNAGDLAELSAEGCQKIIETTSSIAARQIAEFPDIYWVAIPYNADNGCYKKKYDELQQILGGVKNVRKFCQLTEQEGSRKCALDGERTALFYKPFEGDNGSKRAPSFLSKESKEIVVNRSLFEHGEAISAVSFIKRFYEKGNSFPSTAEIALMNVPTLFKDTYEEHIKGAIDYQLFYEENLTEKNRLQQGIEFKKKYTLDDVKKALKALPTAEQKLTKYYALLLFDGDSFGKLWSGECLKDKTTLLSFQKELSEKLHIFAQDAKKYLDKPKGKTVYTGGDDFLGFVNLNCLFDVLLYLRKTFNEIIDTPLRHYLEDNKKITFTSGIVIAHYKAPLGEVLKRAHVVEEAAKKRYEDNGKDAFGICVMKSSGEINQAFLQFFPVDYSDGSSVLVNALETLKKVVQEIKKSGAFSHSFISAFHRTISPLMNKEGSAKLVDKAVSYELKRLLSKACRLNGEDKKKEVESFSEVIEQLRHVSGKELNFITLLHICDFIKRETSEKKRETSKH